MKGAMDPESVLEIQQYIHVAHHKPGRIRIKFKANLVRHPLVKRMFESLSTRPGMRFPTNPNMHPGAGEIPGVSTEATGIERVRVNWLGRSVIVHYDPARFRPQWVHEFMTTRDPDRMQEMIHELKSIFSNQ